MKKTNILKSKFAFIFRRKSGEWYSQFGMGIDSYVISEYIGPVKVYSYTILNDG
jgi:hypothetical protein